MKEQHIFGTFNLTNDGHREPVDDLNSVLQTKEKSLEDKLFTPYVDSGSVTMGF